MAHCPICEAIEVPDGLKIHHAVELVLDRNQPLFDIEGGILHTWYLQKRGDNGGRRVSIYEREDDDFYSYPETYAEAVWEALTDCG